MFIMVDGIDGAGKSTVIDTWIDFLQNKNAPILSLRTFWKTHGRHPTPEEFKPHTVIISAEPTFVGIGKKIREEMIVSGTPYTPRQIAEAYAEDRKILYAAVIVPALQKNLLVIQDRGVSTSLCYQPLHHTDLTPEVIANIPGNAFALTHAPNHLILVDIEPAIAISRLLERQKQDRALFEKESFLIKARQRFLSHSYQELFRSRGTHIHILNGGVPLAIMKEEALRLLKHIL